MRRVLRALVGVFVAVIAMLVAAPSASAHEFGPFAIDRYAGLLVSPDGIELDYVLGLAETPTQSDGDRIEGDPQAFCVNMLDEIELTVDGAPVTFGGLSASVLRQDGDGGLTTLRVECNWTAPLDSSSETRTLRFTDGNYEGRVGWREVVVVGDRTEITGDVSDDSVTERLTDFPDADENPSTAEAEFDFTASPDVDAAQLDDTVPGADDGRGDAFSDLIADADGGVWAMVVALGFAAFLGALHSLAPGHGKSVIGAYLVGTRGTKIQALVLAIAVALSHTLGVLVLGVITYAAGAAFAPERVYPWLQGVSALIVLGIGIWLVVTAVRDYRGRRARGDAPPRHENVDAHGHLHTDGHDHSHHHGADGHDHGQIDSENATDQVSVGGGHHAHSHDDGGAEVVEANGDVLVLAHSHEHGHDDGLVHSHAHRHPADVDAAELGTSSSFAVAAGAALLAGSADVLERDHGDHDHSHGDHVHDPGDHDHSHGDHVHDHGDHDHSHGDHVHEHGDHDHSHDGHVHEHGDHDHSHGDHVHEHGDHDHRHDDHVHEHGDHDHDHSHGDHDEDHGDHDHSHGDHDHDHGDHDHDHGDHDHSHGDHDHQHGDGWHRHGIFPHTHRYDLDEIDLAGKVSWKTLALLGLSGGLVPSTSAIIVLLGAIQLNRIAFGGLLILAFGLGMAIALVSVGLGMVALRDRAFGTMEGNQVIETARRYIVPFAAAAVLVVGVFLVIRAGLEIGDL